MKAVVFAYHNFGIAGIQRLMDAGFEILLVFTHEDDPDENIWFGSVVDFCKEVSLPYVTPGNPNTPECIEEVRKLSPEILFSFYYRHMISSEILKIPRLGGYNLHGSYLPAYRGRCPINWVIINGERSTGVTLHQMVEKPDAGPIVAQRKIEISSDDTALSLFKKMENEADILLKDVLPSMKSGKIFRQPQDLSKGSYFSGRRPDDGRIIWNRPAVEIYNLIRGVTRPYPGAFAFVGQEKVFFWWAVHTDEIDQAPGKIVVAGDTVLIGTGKGCLCPLEIEVEGSVLKGKELFEWFKHHKGEKVR